MSLTDPSSLAAPDEDIPLSDVLTRDLLRSGKLDRMVAAAVPDLRLMSDAEREASMRQTLAARPAAEEGAWVFAYGSLMWNPTIHHVDRRVARVEGWHRSFCLSTPIGRGTPENPGLVLALDEGGWCDGVALRLDEGNLLDELSLLWRREMLTVAYRVDLH